MISKTVSIIGSGNMAWHLMTWLRDSEFVIQEQYCRNIQKDRNSFTGIKKDIHFVDNLNDLSATSDIYVLCVPDDALERVIQSWPFPLSSDQMIIHCSGIKSSTILKDITTNFGVFWPVQTLKKDVPNTYPPSIIITAHNEFVAAQLIEMAKVCTMKFELRTDEEKEKLHIAAVFVNNFSNHLLGLAKDFCEGNQLDFSILDNILLETALKAISSQHPFEVQTGPAVRNDFTTLNRHLELLENNPPLKTLYITLTQSIQRVKINS